MPLYKTLNKRNGTQIWVWKIEETEAELRRGIELSTNSLLRLSKMSSSLHRKGFLSIRRLLSRAGYSDHQLLYGDTGKPSLHDGKSVSITHSFEFTALITSNVKVGIDIEKQREKITSIAHKFVGSETFFLDTFIDKTRELTIIWGAKESMYKLYGIKGLGFREHCHVESFQLYDGKTTAAIEHHGKRLDFEIHFEEMEGFTLVYALPHE
ncbi:MAG: 4'-phosphopantetheinyl transferase superfamily protein [Nonlabens sp.]